MLKHIITISLLVLSQLAAFATHNRAGEITYRQISDLTFEFTITTITNTKPTSDGTQPADRSELPIDWGDNTFSILPRVAIYKLSDSYNKNIYKGQHTFPAPSTYTIFVEDPNRNEGVENIPNSVNVVFSIKTIMQINPVLGVNNTPTLLNPPIDKAAVNRVFVHNPAAFDPDGDSLSYDMTVCTGESGKPIETYTLPPSKNRPIYITPDGNLTWDTPMEPGAYNVAFLISEWRKGVKIGQITRDMQIEVFDSDNTPPIIDSIPPQCVVAGSTLNLNVSATDSTNDIITLTATGGVFEVENPATFTSVDGTGSATGLLKWNTTCNHVRQTPYQVVFKAVDNNAEINLVDQKSTYITVIGPAPQNLQLAPSNNTMQLSWDPYICRNIQGFNIYRSTKSFNYTPDYCETGVPAYTGFVKIATLNDINAVQYLDNNNGLGLNQGYEYCYMVTALFDDSFESQASAEVCGNLVQGVPVITNVSVTNHHQTNGSIFVAWQEPNEFDSVKYPGPHIYIVKRANGVWGTDYINIDTLFSLSDTNYTDHQINTLGQAYNYKIEIHNPNGLTEMPMTASSIWPILNASNHTLDLTIEHNTPWQNNRYTIFRQNGTVWDSIGTSNTPAFSDTGLMNHHEYCYRITSYGEYDLDFITKPLINVSHQNCLAPIDTTPPTAPVLDVEANCTTFTNTLSWKNSYPRGEVIKYNIYFSANGGNTFSLVDSTLNQDSTRYLHLTASPTACYKVTAVDSSNNESLPSAMVCVDVCPYYELPNVFTPNGDNVNDLFIPITPAIVIENYIEKIDIKIYSRWGGLVFETTDPKIKWNGQQINTGKLVSPGVYYYVCDVYERRLTGIEPRYLTGVIHVFYGDGQKNE